MYEIIESPIESTSTPATRFQPLLGCYLRSALFPHHDTSTTPWHVSLWCQTWALSTRLVGLWTTAAVGRGDWIAKKWKICASEQKVDFGTEVQMKFRRPNDWMTQRKRCCRSVGCRVRDFDLLPNR